MAQTPDPGIRAFIVQPVLSLKGEGRERVFVPSLEEKIEEAKGLAHAIWLEVIGIDMPRVARPSPGHFLGKGTRERIAAVVAQEKPDVVIVNHSLTPVQQRNLEKEWQAKVIDRTGLILEIFGARAQTKEGQIQVALAALEYQKSRLVRSWTHLERQRGGTGKTGGPGETQLEIDRRLISDRIAQLKKDLERVRKNRDLQRRSREKVPYPIVALVGYTNAGKSTLFNRLTGADVFAENLLFATLDPTMRKVRLENRQEIILADTVGFITALPTHLVAAFRSTLEQVQYADVILHVRDISNSAHEAQKEDVVSILGDMGIEYESDPRIIEILNKTDALNAEQKADALRRASFAERTVPVSAVKGEGVEALLAAIQKIVSAGRRTVSYHIKPENGQALAWLYDRGKILDRKDELEYITLTAELDLADAGRFQERFGIQPVQEDVIYDTQKQIHG
ncbi:MAG: GTPase HflX [Proteobacteria bacterium]|nr:GTPase HflX [Pseudomonadota bacterium]